MRCQVNEGRAEHDLQRQRNELRVHAFLRLLFYDTLLVQRATRSAANTERIR